MDITLHHEEGCGWKASARATIDGRPVSYNGEYKPTIQAALDSATKALSLYGLLDKAS